MLQAQAQAFDPNPFISWIDGSGLGSVLSSVVSDPSTSCSASLPPFPPGVSPSLIASSSENASDHYHPPAEVRPRHHGLTPINGENVHLMSPYKPFTTPDTNGQAQYVYSIKGFEGNDPPGALRALQAVGIEYTRIRNLHSDHVKANRVFKQVAHDATAKDSRHRVPLIALNIPDSIWEYAYEYDADVGSTSTVHFEYDADPGTRPGTIVISSLIKKYLFRKNYE
ncbi:hypothetical protein EDB89DRAFT_2233257 [Lactarius sanguifluus]|nr:hypothetical protein EDB89DRAFT_2233257 [Lactarius sanguifluus]